VNDGKHIFEVGLAPFGNTCGSVVLKLTMSWRRSSKGVNKIP